MKSSTCATSEPSGHATARVAAALWIGGLWALVFVVPVLFWRLPLAVAGGIAGILFAVWQGLGLVLGLVVARAVSRRGRPWPAIAWTAWGLDAAFECAVLPIMAFLRSRPRFGPGRPTWDVFLALHGLATALYGGEALLGIALVAWALEG